MDTATTAISGLKAFRLPALLVLECLLLLALAEGFITWTSLDMRILAPLLYYQNADLEVHRPSEDPRLHYELKPGAAMVFKDRGSRKVTINSLGFRDRPRSPVKPAGVTRIFCLGSSNTYGAMVNDHQTYPARLESLLNSRSPGKYEVWNAGVCAYVIPQNLAAAGKIIREYSPDLLIFQTRNRGRRPFLYGQPFKRYFDLDPGLYRENLRFCWPRSLDFLRHWRLLRAMVFSVNRLAMSPDADTAGWKRDYENMVSEERQFGEFCREYGDSIPIIILRPPGDGGGHNESFTPQDIPTLRLSEKLPDDHAPEFDEIHPPAHVYQWYAGEIQKALWRAGLLPAAR